MTSAAGYDPARCDLCGSTATRTLLSFPGRSMTSDSRVVSTSLEKIGCLGCGLVRNAQAVGGSALADHYGTDYKLAEQAASAEPLAFVGGNVMARSEVVADAVAWAAEQAGVEPGRLLEVGCGEGLLLERLAGRWPDAAVAGLDLGTGSVELARARGLDVRRGSYEDAEGPYDLIVSVAVVEHVPSPRHFLDRVRAALADDGALVVAAPVQGGNSYDLFFSDHLHHFSPQHVAALAAEGGVVEVAARTLAPAYPDFALHALRRAADKPFVPAIPAEPVLDAVQAQAERWLQAFERVNAWLAALEPRELAVWGLGQAYTLLLAYSDLDEPRIAVGLDDNPDRFAGTVPFPVRTLEEWRADGGRPLPVLLAFPPSAAVRARLEAAGIDFHAPFTRHDR
jgi:2-polyprenyl-3-methyl-5-hydroxy-6-metoxy-1,4-benzoquinol methylase